jgi:TonB family protein
MNSRTVLILVSDSIPPTNGLPTSHPKNVPSQQTTSDVIPTDETESPLNDTIYYDVELMPQYYGGIDSLMRYLGAHIKYPTWEYEHNIQGTIYITFVVSSEGKIKEPKISKTVAESKNFDAEVLRVISAMPDWIPGEHEGKKVDVSFKLPITFRR